MKLIKTILILILTGAYIPISAQNPVTEYEIDNGHTFVTFEVKRFDMLDVVSTFQDIQGIVNFNADNISETSADITINTQSLFSGNEQRDNAIKGPAFLNTEEYQTITFETTGMDKSGDEWVAVGNLTILGNTNEVRLPVTFTGPRKDPTGLTTLAVKGAITINRQDFGMRFDRKLPNGSSVIGDSVYIEINALTIKK